ncbi:glutamate--cysteine ligase EgtA [Sphaerisporangium krabiense]|uniref:Glutamate--cysteine ligase EgtA n=1 Tax=Sphaerisporangium krabiense TaxID=763782 RepID=A0A7W8ZCU3_9ACTN|nr:ergothioneine biosynthesis glutamate--cysteine ligase EgtA [Sphaerisporangium krabiense]MBB5631677.1 glutamate--cysteine ligase [Sphaerisporangium krabiense]GII60684.1 glutamate--cysteine ligase EgtA [Sphaerisporangium krabiense]
MIGTENSDARVRDLADVEEFARRCFQGSPGDQVGVELEFLVFDRADPARQVGVSRIIDALPPLTRGSALTFEPGGQLELSGSPAPLARAVRQVAADLDTARRALGDDGLLLAGIGLDPIRPPERQLRAPRYEAMAELLGVPYGPLMMCLSASIQVNVDLGPKPAVRWERACALGPVLNAAFANSPLTGSRPCGWMSGRQAVWLHLDPTRTRPVVWEDDPAAAWARYLMDARLMLLREKGTRRPPSPSRATFADWTRSPHLGGHPPTVRDLAYHATTVFPPVRPRGWLEVRYLDALPPRWWPACVAVTGALLLDDRAADAALAAAAPLADRWWHAARVGLGDPRVRRAAEECFRAAAPALPRLGAEPWLVADVESYAERHVVPGRSPAAEALRRAREPGAGPLAWLSEEVVA